MTRFYHCDPMAFTYRAFIDHMKQMQRVRMWERGEDPDAGPKSLSTEEFVNELLAGNVKVEDLDEPKRAMSDEDKRRTESQLRKFMGRG